MNTRQHFLVPLFIWNFVMMFPKPNESWHFKFIISSNSSIFGCLNEDASAIAFQMRIYIIVCSNSVIDIVLCAAMNDTNYNVCIWSDLNVTGRFFLFFAIWKEPMQICRRLMDDFWKIISLVSIPIFLCTGEDTDKRNRFTDKRDWFSYQFEMFTRILTYKVCTER